MQDHPVAVVLVDDLRRSRLTVFFRIFLAIPHLIWFALWSLLTAVLAIVAWVATLATGRLPAGLHRFFCSYVRYSAHVFAYLTLVVNAYPDFTGADGSYGVELRLPATPEPQARSRTFFRLLLALPALLVAGALGGIPLGSSGTRTNGNGTSGSAQAGGIAVTTAVLGWFACVATGRMPRGLRDVGVYAVGYRSQVLAYLLFLTDRYPNADPLAMLGDLEPPPLHPVHVTEEHPDLHRSRVTVFFRLALAIPHLVWLILWSVLAILVVIAQWFVTLVRGRPAAPLQRFLARYIRYSFQVSAFLSLAAGPFPGFAGRAGSYPVDLVLPEPARQSRWKTLFRFFLGLPASVIAGALFGALAVDAILTWFAALFTGKAPAGLRELSVYALRYNAQAYSYLFLLTDAYPHSSPLEGFAPEPEPVLQPAAETQPGPAAGWYVAPDRPDDPVGDSPA